MAFRINFIVLATIFCLQTLNSALAKPHASFCGCDGFEGGLGPVALPPPIPGDGCAPVSPPITFLPVPQPVPIRIPQPQPPKQSVTIPNIILALLPPNQRAPVAPPKPIIRPAPAPIVLPLPQPYPVPIGGGDRCGCN